MLTIGVLLMGACAHKVATLDEIWSGPTPGEIYVRTTVQVVSDFQPTASDPHLGLPIQTTTSYLLRCQDEAFSPSPRPVLTCEPIATIGDILQAALLQQAIKIPRPKPDAVPSEVGPVDPITGLR